MPAPIAEQLGRDGLLVRRSVVLSDQLDRQLGGSCDRTRVGLLGARDQSQQRRFAGAVCADDADPLALVDSERQPVQQLEPTEALDDRMEVDEVAWRDPA